MTMFIKVENEVPTGHAVVEDNLKVLFPEHNFPAIWTPVAAQALGFGIYEFTQVPEAPRFKKAIEVPPSRAPNGIYYQAWQIVDMTSEEQAAATEERAEQVRMHRNFKLMQCDWTQLQDAPLNEQQKASWVAYRQQLREVPTQQDFPWDVSWPDAPAGAH
jgi:hypothetical protein